MRKYPWKVASPSGSVNVTRLAEAAVAGAAAELEHPCARLQVHGERVAPLGARGADDAVAPVVERGSELPVARAEDVRVTHPVITSTSPAAASARSRASRFVDPRAIT